MISRLLMLIVIRNSLMIRSSSCLVDVQLIILVHGCLYAHLSGHDPINVVYKYSIIYIIY